jgi:chromosomal replication initiator protein
LARPRQVAMYLTRYLTPYSYPVIARHFNRDHTTIMHAINVITQLALDDPELKSSVEKLRAQLFVKLEKLEAAHDAD